MVKEEKKRKKLWVRSLLTKLTFDNKKNGQAFHLSISHISAFSIYNIYILLVNDDNKQN